MTSFGATSYGYDRNGNLTSFGSNSLTYDQANKWTGGTINGSSVAFGYDGHGRRTNRSIAGARTDYWYDWTGLTLETGAASGAYLRDPDGLLLSTTASGAYRNYARDRQGTITGLVSTAPSLTDSYRYDPWGQSIGTSGTAYNPFRYTGTYLDSGTGLYQMGARYYQPGTGRFTQLDPHPKMLLRANRYAYAGCNPTNYVDPTGFYENPVDACFWGAAAVVGAALAVVALWLLIVAVVLGVGAIALPPLIFILGNFARLAITGCVGGVISYFGDE